jgi:hypothetical protein
MGINQYRETSLHLALKHHLANADAQLEAEVNGYIVDILQDQRIIEIQTGNFGAMKRKLSALLPHYPITIAHPIPSERWLISLDQNHTVISKRKSTKRGNIYHLFNELVYLPTDILTHKNLSFVGVMTHDEEIRIADGQGSWRRKGMSIFDRKLVQVIGLFPFNTSAELIGLLPDDLPTPFTTADLASALSQPKRIIQRMAFTLKQAGLITITGKKGNAYCYAPCLNS